MFFPNSDSGYSKKQLLLSTEHTASICISQIRNLFENEILTPSKNPIGEFEGCIETRCRSAPAYFSPEFLLATHVNIQCTIVGKLELMSCIFSFKQVPDIRPQKDILKYKFYMTIHMPQRTSKILLVGLTANKNAFLLQIRIKNFSRYTV